MRIEICELSKKYGNHIVFDNFNLNILDNKITCLYGASGCGKTTILNIIGQIENFNSGIIKYDGKIIKRRKERIKFLRNDVGFIFQDFGLIENETVLENMKLVYNIRKQKDYKTRIEKLLKRMNLDNMINRKVFELSGGEQQRVAIAKVILKNPSLILADEPTASLDEKNKNIVLSLLRKMQENGKTVIIVSHDEEVKEFADVAIDLSRGSINV